MLKAMTVFEPGGLRTLSDVADGAAEIIALVIAGDMMPEQAKAIRPVLDTAATVIMAKAKIEDAPNGNAQPGGAHVDINMLFQQAQIAAGGGAVPMAIEAEVIEPEPLRLEDLGTDAMLLDVIYGH